MKQIDLPVWEQLQKRMTWAQIGELRGQKILDFGSGNGATASHFAQHNQVVAIEPALDAISNRIEEYPYYQICGSLEELQQMEDHSFDAIFCHNVFEYTSDRKQIMKECSRLLKNGGMLSVLKHNRAGRVMQMVVLLNRFEHAAQLLDGQNGSAERYGEICYYEDQELTDWCDDFTIENILGQRTFWDLQQDQEIQKDPIWQEQMLQMEHRVSVMKEFQEISFFHHVILKRK